MVRPGGFEPPTSWFVAMRSIQLIYGRTPKTAVFAEEVAHPAKPPHPCKWIFHFNPKIPSASTTKQQFNKMHLSLKVASPAAKCC